MSIIGLDLSLTATGYADESRIEVWRPKNKGHERFLFILDAINAALTWHSDAIIAIEGFSFGSKGRSLYEIAGLGYLVRHELWTREVPYVEVPPSSLKKYATGRGNVGKDEMIAAAIRRFGYEGPADNNAVDAFLLRHFMLQHDGTPEVEVPKANQAAADIELTIVIR